MSIKDQRNAAHKFKDPNWWWYEEPTGIRIVHEVRDDDFNYLRTEYLSIEWRALRKALERRDK